MFISLLFPFSLQLVSMPLTSSFFGFLRAQNAQIQYCYGISLLSYKTQIASLKPAVESSFKDLYTWEADHG